MAIRYYKDEFNAIRRINRAIERAFSRYGKFTKEYQQVKKSIIEQLDSIENISIGNIYSPYTIDSNGLIQIKNTAILRQALSGKEFLREIEKFKPSLKAMKEKYPSGVTEAEYTFLSTASFSFLYDAPTGSDSFIEDNPLLTQDQKDTAVTLMRSYGGQWNKEDKIDTFIDVVRAAMTDPDMNIENVLQQMGMINYEDTPPEGTGFTYSGRLGM